jgi:hypothetical protein
VCTLIPSTRIEAVLPTGELSVLVSTVLVTGLIELFIVLVLVFPPLVCVRRGFILVVVGEVRLTREFDAKSRDSGEGVCH